MIIMDMDMERHGATEQKTIKNVLTFGGFC